MSQARLVNSGLIPLPFGANSRLSRRPKHDHRVNAVLVPADVQKRKESRTLQQNQSRGLAGALLSAFKALEREKMQNMQVENAPKGPTERVSENTKSETRSKKNAQSLPQIDAYLRSVGIMELRYIRMLSNLCSLTYHMDKLSATSMMRRHNLKLITSSLQCEISPRLAQVSAFMAVVDGDAMAADISTVMSTQKAVAESAATAEPSPAMIALSKVEPITSTSISVPPPSPVAAVSTVESSSSTITTAADSSNTNITTNTTTTSSDSNNNNTNTDNNTTSSPAAMDVVAQSLAAAAAAASSAADTVVSAAAPIAAPIASNISAFTSSASVRSVASQLQSAASIGQSTAIATIATVTAAVQATVGVKDDIAVSDAALAAAAAAAAATNNTDITNTITTITNNNGSKDCSSPTEWFVADDVASKIRYIVIQGSDNVDHWRVNLTFDPVTFEDASLGIKVHRGVYEAAKQLYDRFLPMILDHVSSSPTARIALTGHSLGGSLATVLMMMLVHRGVVDASNLLPVYTFGAPAIFCQGCSSGDCSIVSNNSNNSNSNSNNSMTDDDNNNVDEVLSRFHLPPNSVRNIIMHKDIVPRAFACDYSPVADILKRVSESFKEHRCLSGERRVMFHFVGKMMVLQPSNELTFVQSDGYHGMLPRGPGLYALRDHSNSNSMNGSNSGNGSGRVVVSNASPHAVHAMDTNTTMNTTKKTPSSPSPSSSINNKNKNNNKSTIHTTTTTTTTTVQSSKEAIWHLMNNPHPLTILSDPGAYGDAGSISRYHNPDNYTRALGGILRSRGEKGKNIINNAKQVGVMYYTPVLKRMNNSHGGGGIHSEEKGDHSSSSIAATVHQHNHNHGGNTNNSSSNGGKMHLPPLHRRP